ncbi:MAG: N-acetylmuramoyl-L-alanine amidase [bacterium]|nr:N-acetylmuramoyl-L-alanine amidase [bacterium]
MLLSVGVMTPFQGAVSWVSQGTRSASVFFVQSITVAQIQSNYHGVQFGDSVSTPSPVPTPSEKKVRILVVPGHQPERGGTEFNGVYERDIVVDIADTLAELISQNRHYDVMVSRTKTRWHPILQKYFDTSVLEIETFRQSLALQMEKYLALGSILPEADQVYHNTTSSEASLQLYGINKWASDNKYDIILHLHLNDYAGRRARAVGQHDGFTIYVPDNQYSNAVASKSVAEAIAVRLSAYHATSTLPKEDKGVVEDQELIAIGSNNSVDGAALLIEYGYIYEPQFRNPSIRSVAVADYAYQTYLGLQDFFKDPLSPTFGSISFPYEWSAINAGDGVSGPGIYALQSALRYLGYYPPAGRRFSDCPISGVVGPCTRSAIAAYQHAHGLTVTGTLGPKTRAELESDLSAP